ncbi:serine O-acetyltransferase [Teredinibacter turnerae]|uniref:Serine acetyltransferase n=1 Tax=Teredinibacter turnerae (strain ATCC 39867 / T7901) TaxID=377629 RepID=C5BNU0_TERTT|nr:serine O-acetyltransferase [Teredinibacter turnerae]ACR13924.1 serine acetyltransferase [Teredinibacter turnerae T7901]
MQAKQPRAVVADPVWETIRQETLQEAEQEPALASFLHATILNHSTLESALSFHLANKLASPALSALQVREIIEDSLENHCDLGDIVRADIKAVFDRDSACDSYLLPFLYFKGFHALESFRVSNCLFKQGRKSLAFFLQSHIALTFGVDIHPAAKIGRGIMLDHATGIVIGETTVVDDDVSIMQAVTLGGTGKEAGDRHPKIRRGVLISAGAKILGNIEIGEGAKVGAGSVVLKPVEPHTTVVGVPAVTVGKPNTDNPALDMNHQISCDC